MKKRSERSVRELYDRTMTIDEAEMTPIEGNYGNQGPAKLENDLQRMKTDNNSAHQRNMFCGDMRAETGTCNVCTAPCSSCMHRIAMEANVDCDSSDNMCHRKETDICSFVGSKSRASPDLQHAASEASNFLTASSSHDSSSDNAESKATLQATITFDTTEAVGMPVKALMIEKLGQAPVCHTNTDFTGKGSCSNSTLFVHQNALWKHESDCHGESNSCISGARDTCMQKSDQIADMEKKDTSCSSALECNMDVNECTKVEEICNSVGTNQDKLIIADPQDSGTSNPKYEVNIECKMVGDPSSRLFKEETREVSGLDGCDGATRNASTNEQHNPVNGDSHLLDCHKEAHVLAKSQACESEVLFDVNVCDICGDAGKEDRLATCSRCLDGAEHIYCMRNMLDKLPEGDWLCEECQMKELSEKKRLSKSGSISRLSKAHHLSEKIQNSRISVDRKNLPKSDLKSTDVEICHPSESPKKLDNKLMSHKDIMSSSSKNASQIRHDSTSPRKDVSPFLETSYKNSNLLKGKTSEIASSPRRLPAYNFQASSRPNAPSSNFLKSERELSTPRKILQKQLSSDSMGIMPKPKQLLKVRSEVISRELASRDIRKEGTAGALIKSTSFKSSNSGQASYGLLSKSQMIKSPRTEDAKGFKSMKEGKSLEKKKSSVLERPVGKSLTNSVKPILEVGVKGASNAGNSNSRSEVNILSSGKVSNVPKSRSHKLTDAENKKTGDAVKGVAHANSVVATNISKNIGVSLRPQIADTPNYTFQDDKGMDSVSGGSKQVTIGKDVQLHSHKLKDLDRAMDSCHDDNIKVPSMKPSANVNLKKRNRWRDAVDAAIAEKVQKRTKSSELPEHQKESNNTVIAEVPPKSSFSNKIHGKSFLSEAKSNGDQSLKNIDLISGKREGSKAEKLEFDLNTALTVTDDLKEPSFQCMTDCAYLLSSSIGASSFPQHDFIWRGDFEISRTGRCSEVLQKESNNTVIAEVPPKSSFSNKIHGKSFLSEAKSNGDQSLKNIDLISDKREGSKAEKLEFDLNTALTVTDDLKEPSFQCMTDCAYLLSSSIGASSFPQHDFIWRGDFEISRTGRRSEVVKGIQAHLSFSASPKVPLVAGQFPCKIQLKEVPRVGSWPLQFQETSPTDENIALYFFAEDFASYEKSYQRLLDDMLKSDLALIGTINEVELLIFHSCTLPEASQRWNMLFFLWGVFRGRKFDSSNALANNLREQSNCFELTNDTFVRESVSSFQKVVSVDSPKEKMVRSGKSVKMEESNDILKMDESPIKRAFGEVAGTGSFQQSDNASHSYHMNWIPGSIGTFQSPIKAFFNYCELNDERPCAAMTRNETFVGHTDNDEAKNGFYVRAHDEENVNKPFCGLFVPSESVRGDRSSVSLEETIGKIPVKNETEQVTPAIMGTDGMNWKLNKRCLFLCSTQLQSEGLTGTLKSTVFQGSTHLAFGEDDRTSKRMKFCSDGYDSSSFRGIDEDSKSTVSNIYLFSGVCSEQVQREDSNCSGWMPEKSKLAESRNSGPINFIDVSSDDEDSPNYSTIDLNLALGPSKRQLEETLASVPQFNSGRRGKLPNSSVDDGHDTSDSLSLALPLARTGKLMQKSFKIENLFPEEPEGSTPLSLFWDGT